jgi:dynein heavy chain
MQASKEASLEKALAKMKADWEGMEFRVVAYKDTGTFVIGGTDDVQARWLGGQCLGNTNHCCKPPAPVSDTPRAHCACFPVQALLDDHIVKAQSMRSSPFLKPFEAEAVEWEQLLLRTQVGHGWELGV